GRRGLQSEGGARLRRLRLPLLHARDDLPGLRHRARQQGVPDDGAAPRVALLPLRGGHPRDRHQPRRGARLVSGMTPGEEPDDDTSIGAPPPALVEPVAGSRGEGDASTAEADTIIREGRPTKPRPKAAAKERPEPGGHPVSFIRIGSHEPIPLDVPAYVGRRPSSPRITGGRMPRLVMVPSPSREVSATHLEIRQEGAVVVVTDLGSTNGTLVTHPLGR